MAYGIDNERAYNAAIQRKIARACAEKFNNKFKPEHPEVDWEKAYNSNNRFVQTLLSNGTKYGKLSEKQLEAITNSLARDEDWRNEKNAERKAEYEALTAKGVIAPEGRVEVIGKVLTVRVETKLYSYHNEVEVVKLLVKSIEGWKVWVSAGKDIADDVKVGDDVCFTATLTRKDGDELFAFGKRPTKAVILNKEKR